MKRVLLTVMSVVMSAGVLPAQTPGRKHSLSVDVRPVSSGGNTRSRNNLNVQQSPNLPGFYRTRNENFSSSRTRGSGVGLALEVRNLSQNPDEAVLEWYFIGKPVSGGGFFIFDQGSKKVTIGAGSREIVEVESKELTSTVERNLVLRSGYPGGALGNQSTAGVKKSGNKVAGWIVRLVADNQILQVRASGPSLEAIGKNQSQTRLLP